MFGASLVQTTRLGRVCPRDWCNQVLHNEINTFSGNTRPALPSTECNATLPSLLQYSNDQVGEPDVIDPLWRLLTRRVSLSVVSKNDQNRCLLKVIRCHSLHSNTNHLFLTSRREAIYRDCNGQLAYTQLSDGDEHATLVETKKGLSRRAIDQLGYIKDINSIVLLSGE